ncbi:MAG: hypothetical protein F6K14_20125 [Symploca sp. SIO2C1]|nr:hypothetical protein [Symploca sp. SIO2C1]
MKLFLLRISFDICLEGVVEAIAVNEEPAVAFLTLAGVKEKCQDVESILERIQNHQEE